MIDYKLKQLINQSATSQVIIKYLKSIISWPNENLQQEIISLIKSAYSKGCIFSQKWLYTFIKSVIHDVEQSDVYLIDDLPLLLIEGIGKLVSDYRFNNTNLELAEDVGYTLYDLKALAYPVLIRVVKNHNQVGCRIWEAALFLIEFFLSKNEILDKINILELGAGVGVTSLLISALKQYRPSQIYLSDNINSVLENLDYNINLNNETARHILSGDLSPCITKSLYLDWVNMDELNIKCIQSEIILAADCTYSADISFHLAKCLVYLLTDFKKGINRQNTTDIFKSYPYALVACTLRNQETYEYFLNALYSFEAKVIDITDNSIEQIENSDIDFICYPSHILGVENPRKLVRLLYINV